MITTYDIFLTIGLLVNMATVYLVYSGQLQIIKKLRSLGPTIAPDPYAPKERRFSENLKEIREMRKMPKLKEKATPAPTRQQALTALNAIASGANDIREQF